MRRKLFGVACILVLAILAWIWFSGREATMAERGYYSDSSDEKESLN